MKVVHTTKAPEAIGPYSQGRVVGNLLFTAGQCGINPKTGDLCEGLIEQAHQTFQNLAEILEAAGSGFDKVIKTTLFVKDMSDFSKVNLVYSQYFTTPYPARSCVEVARLPKDALVECELIAEI